LAALCGHGNSATRNSNSAASKGGKRGDEDWEFQPKFQDRQMKSGWSKYGNLPGANTSKKPPLTAARHGIDFLKAFPLRHFAAF
jgi:hypothetical protein